MPGKKPTPLTPDQEKAIAVMLLKNGEFDPRDGLDGTISITVRVPDFITGKKTTGNHQDQSSPGRLIERFLNLPASAIAPTDYIATIAHNGGLSVAGEGTKLPDGGEKWMSADLHLTFNKRLLEKTAGISIEGARSLPAAILTGYKSLLPQESGRAASRV